MSLKEKINRAIVFVHYDKNDMVDDYVYYYLQELKKSCSYLLFVSTAKLSDSDTDKLSKYCSDIIIRANTGYDFMSYKVGLESFDYLNYDQLVICNDSVYGPIYSLESVFQEMGERDCDFWGLTDNDDISYHLQSYFLVFDKSATQSKAFKAFWDQVEVLNNKNDIIEKYEIGLTKELLNNQFRLSVYATYQPKFIQKINIFLKKLRPSKIMNKLIAVLKGADKINRIGKINSTHYFWRELILSGKMPFIKIELLRDNPMNIDINDFEHIIKKISDYDTKMIKKHLSRMKA